MKASVMPGRIRPFVRSTARTTDQPYLQTRAMHPPRSLPILFAFALLLAACGGATTPTARDAPPTALGTDAGRGGGSGGLNACVNTIAEVSAALGVTVVEMEKTLGDSQCTYYTDKAASKWALVVTLWTGAAATKIQFDAAARAVGAEAVSGIGDEAAWSRAGLLVRKGDKMLLLFGWPLLDQAKLRTALAGLARTALGRL